ncbi:hypothetical protein XBFM1_1710019 [Xenorhabdus bovienii str. feltiae Moldova]|uniref:Uncharacterized protein n=1 Tax=Xenorhabdus bovienii str. feltiae Moldova TaxID=1398200 RepID=A0A077NSH2_XENBV|nr:hypothetical protein XBFM1_1710019 [Xenorhabdus bovienii str. feltiae Moldova]
MKQHYSRFNELIERLTTRNINTYFAIFAKNN